jgi:hypothetical protein
VTSAMPAIARTEPQGLAVKAPNSLIRSASLQ